MREHVVFHINGIWFATRGAAEAYRDSKPGLVNTRIHTRVFRTGTTEELVDCLNTYTSPIFAKL